MLAVASGPTRLLKVGLDAVRAVHVHHQPHVGLVNAHSEGIGGHHHPHLIVLPLSLSLVFHGWAQTGMVEGGGNATGVEFLADVARLLAAARINHGAARHRTQNVNEFSLLVLRLPHHVGQVAALETHLEHVALGKLEQLLYVVHHQWGGCGGERQDRHTGQ